MNALLTTIKQFRNSSLDLTLSLNQQQVLISMLMMWLEQRLMTRNSNQVNKPEGIRTQDNGKVDDTIKNKKQTEPEEYWEPQSKLDQQDRPIRKTKYSGD